jgi:hypothetical protein
LLVGAEPAAMEWPSLDDVRAVAGRRVRLVVPKPRAGQRIEGTVAVDGAGGSDRFGRVELRERERDSVLRAYREDGALVGRVKRFEELVEES